MSQWTLPRNGFGRPGPVLVVVMDGVGLGRKDAGDAVHLANTPVLDRLWSACPTTSLLAHGKAVGLPSDKDMGNSEVGHNALGAGRVFDQGAKLVDEAIRSGLLFEGQAWRELADRCQANRTPMHFIGLLSDGNVHSHIDQLFALINRCHQEGIERVRLHPLLDGRDVPATSALTYIDRLETLLAEINRSPGRDYRIASGGGRMLVTMDRYQADWRIVHRGWKAHVLGEGRPFPSARAAIETFRAEDPEVTDQFLPAFVIADEQGPVGRIEDGSSVVFFNFRGDRAIEISRAFEEAELSHFDRQRRPDVLYAGMMQYDGDLLIPKRFLVSPPAIVRTMGEYLSRNQVRQFACAETQKYGHVTYFWNGNRSGRFDDRFETYLEIPSDQVPFEQRPWMKAAEVTDAVIAVIRQKSFDFGRVNFANGDMVGHTGHLQAAIAAVAAVDLCLDRILDAVAATKGIALITADHGNADQMFEIDGKTGAFLLDAEGQPRPCTAHSLNRVPFTIFDPAYAGEYELDPSVTRPGLSNVAATALWLLGFEAPEDYDPSLVRGR
ncbi:MAG: 2,3-bisphosphoglycerate-independent phosphoglycerate mutase [Bradymonadales bacterium]|nr:2,3-bisphosphoglycerate-independent phosphoglycerate mutase [Bradymonadales bacterium]